MSVDSYVASVVARSEHARTKAEAWRGSAAELEGRAGWMLSAQLAREPALPDPWFAACLREIAEGIHAAPNRKREAMNSALIAIGGYREALREQALAVADAVGEVEIDYGETYCTTPAARAYIEAMAAQAKRAKNKKINGAKSVNDTLKARKAANKKKPSNKVKIKRND